MVYVPMSALYAARFVYSDAETDPMIGALREELYCERYEDIKWSAARDTIANCDVYQPQSNLLTILYWVTYYTLENSFFRTIFYFPLAFLRSRALKFALDYCDAEEDQSNFAHAGPVNKVLNMICTFYRYGPNSARFQHHVDRLHDYL